MVEFVIAVRSFDRAKAFVDRTYNMLSKQIGMNLAERLYLFVANEDQKVLYEEALGDLPLKEIVVVGKKGGKEAIDAITNYFPIGKNILFLDDDHLGFFEFNSVSEGTKPNLDATNMLDYVNDAFQTIEEYGISGFIFRNISNLFWIQKSPFKELKPFFFYGGCFGIKNDPVLVSSTFAQCDDCERTAKILEKDGHILVYNWAGIVFKKGQDYGSNAGGMQSSGDRGEEAKRNTIALYENSPVVKKYFEEPYLNPAVGVYDLKLKKLRYKRDRPMWRSYFENSNKSELEFK